MCKSITSNNSICNDYSLLTANTGLTRIDTANPNLNGTGAMSEVITAGENGTIIKSVFIKAEQRLSLESLTQESTGMVRLFVGGKFDAVLYKELPIPQVPSLQVISFPLPQLMTYEIRLVGGLKLEAGQAIFASTAFDYNFNIVAEGLDWAYPTPLPPECCNFKQQTAIVGQQVISNSVADVLTASPSANGTLIRSVTIKALQSTHEDVVSLYIGDGDDYYMIQEIHVPATEQSAYTPSFKHVVDLDFYLQSRLTLAASSRLAQKYAVTAEGISWEYPI